MDKFDGYDIKLEKADEKGMINGKAIMNYLKKAIKAVCEIKLPKGFGSGFFCKIPLTENNNVTFPVLLTNNHVLSREFLNSHDYITIFIDDDSKDIPLKQRKIWTDEKIDFTCIEIKEVDKIDTFFNLDDNVLNINYSNDEYLNQNVIIFAIDKNNKQMGFSNGLIKKNEGCFFAYTCNTFPGCSGGCIINQFNNNVIGIHRGEIQIKEKKSVNEGIYIRNVINWIRNSKESLLSNTLLKEPIHKFNEGNKINNIDNKKYNYIQENKNNINKVNEQIKKDDDKNNIEENKLNNNDEGIDEIIIQYKIDIIDYSKDIKIFGSKFVQNNKNICKLIINGNEFELCENININKNQLKYNNIFELKLQGIKNITDMSYMFGDDDDWYSGCKLLSSLPDFSNWNTQNITNMSYMFCGCKSLSSLPDISKWNTQKVNNMSYIFCRCESISSLPDISNWNTQKVNNMSGIFLGCKSLSSLPDISKWNTQNVTNMSYMFNNCKSLSSLPDISKWDTQNVIDISSMFEICNSLSSLPDISKWNTQKVTNMSKIFYSCKSLSSLPDISHWYTQNVTNINSMFLRCKSLLSLPDISKWNTQKVNDMSSLFNDCKFSFLPDISKWNTENVTNMSSMFYKCQSISLLPDISKWNTENVTNMSKMFYECDSLSSLPDISKWNTQNVIDMSYMFFECDSLSSLPDISKWNTQKLKNFENILPKSNKRIKIPKKYKFGCFIF